MKKIAALMALMGGELLAQDQPAPPVDPPAPAPTVIPAGHTMQGIPLPRCWRNTVRWWAKP